MGQYHKPVNLTKREFLEPHKFGTGLKLWEQGATECGVLTAVLALCAASNNRGGGDFEPHPMIGRWAGDRLAWIGDYAEDGDLPAPYHAKQIAHAIFSDPPTDGWTDISDQVTPLIESEYQFTLHGDGWKHRHEHDGTCTYPGQCPDAKHAATAKRRKQMTREAATR